MQSLAYLLEHLLLESLHLNVGGGSALRLPCCEESQVTWRGHI